MYRDFLTKAKLSRVMGGGKVIERGRTKQRACGGKRGEKKVRFAVRKKKAEKTRV